MRAPYLKTIAICAMLCPILAPAQDKPKAPEVAPTHYKLVYRMLQMGADGKVSNSHSYSTIIVADDPNATRSKIRNGDHIPVATGEASTNVNGRNVVTQYQYQEVGTNIDTNSPSLHHGQLSLYVSADSSAVIKSAPDSSILAPAIRHLSWESNVVVPLDKPTIIFTSDNVSDIGKTELELTATPIKEP